MTTTITTSVTQDEVFSEVEAVLLATDCQECGAFRESHDQPTEWEFDSVCPECGADDVAPETSIEGFDCHKCGVSFDLWETSYEPNMDCKVLGNDGTSVSLSESGDEHYCRGCVVDIVDTHNDNVNEG